ncbi:MAG: hypothetical protein ABIY47_13070 [Opitutaceae bacterium]
MSEAESQRLASLYQQKLAALEALKSRCCTKPSPASSELPHSFRRGAEGFSTNPRRPKPATDYTDGADKCRRPRLGFIRVHP